MAEGAAPVIAIIQELQGGQGTVVSAPEEVSHAPPALTDHLSAPSTQGAYSSAENSAGGQRSSGREAGREADGMVAAVPNVSRNGLGATPTNTDEPLLALTRRYGSKREAAGGVASDESIGWSGGPTSTSHPTINAADGLAKRPTRTPISALKEHGAPPRSLKKTVTFSPDVVAHDPSVALPTRLGQGGSPASASVPAPVAALALQPTSAPASVLPTSAVADASHRTADADDGSAFADHFDNRPCTKPPVRTYGRKKSISLGLDGLVDQTSSAPSGSMTSIGIVPSSSASRSAGKKRQLKHTQVQKERTAVCSSEHEGESEGERDHPGEALATTTVAATGARGRGTPTQVRSSEALAAAGVDSGLGSRGDEEASLTKSEPLVQRRQGRASASSSGTKKTAARGQKRRSSPNLDPEAASTSDSGSATSSAPGGGGFVKGTVVEVEKRTGPGMNRLGGTARVMAVHAMDRDVCTYDVKYITEGGYEKGITP